MLTLSAAVKKFRVLCTKNYICTYIHNFKPTQCATYLKEKKVAMNSFVLLYC